MFPYVVIFNFSSHSFNQFVLNLVVFFLISFALLFLSFLHIVFIRFPTSLYSFLSLFLSVYFIPIFL